MTLAIASCSSIFKVILNESYFLALSVSRFDAGVSGAAKSFEDRKTAIDQYRINSSEVIR